MLQRILIFNVLIMFLFWISCLIIITPAYNRFIQYGSGEILSSLTQLAVDIRIYLFLLPLLWAIISYRVFNTIRNEKKEKQVESLLLFSMITLTTGLLILVFFGIAGILPYLLIGTAL
jgi:fatty acid desaturase